MRPTPQPAIQPPPAAAAEPAGGGVHGSWTAALRNRLLGSSRFRSWAARFPLTRPIARRRANEVFDLCAGFVYSQVLQACVELDLLDMLRSEPLSLHQLASRLRVPAERLSRLLEAGCSLGLLERCGRQGYALGARGVVIATQPALLQMIRHHREFYADLGDPAALIRGTHAPTRLAAYWGYAGKEGNPERVDASAAAYSTLMSATRDLVIEEVFGAYDFSRHAALLDVGGGEGMFAAEVARRCPKLRTCVFDLPPVAERALARQTDNAFAGRFSAIGGDFRSTALPRNADIVSLIRVVHDHDDDIVHVLLRAIREALPPGGTVLIAEPMCEAGAAGRVGHAYFNLYFLAMGAGRARSATELGALLEHAGFVDVRRHRTALPLCVSVITARRTLE